jgi:hypothetical protein
MPASYLMSWEPTGRRWWKMHARKRYVVSVRQLRKHFNEPSIAETKEGSYQWANRWWEERQQASAQDSYRPGGKPYHPHESELAYLERKREWAQRHRETELERRIEETIEATERLGSEEIPDFDPDRVARGNKQLLESAGVEFPLEFNPFLSRMLIGDDSVWIDRFNRDKNVVPVPSDRTVGNLVARYLDTLLKRHKADQISVGEYSNAKAGLNHFRDWIGARTAVERIDADRWDAYYLHLLGNDAIKSTDTRRKHFRYTRNLLTWMDDLGIHPAPPNLNRRQYRFKGGDKSVPMIHLDVVKNTVSKATGQLKLHLLLMLNCGFIQQDISDLHPSEIDWMYGRIRRKRSRTADRDKVPVVDYLLWDNTFTLLKKYMPEKPVHALMAERGKPWVRDGIHADGSRSRTDAIQSNYRHLTVEGKQPLKMFRKASSTMLNADFRGGEID